jgi:Protein of unknown function (DUF3551)
MINDNQSKEAQMLRIPRSAGLAALGALAAAVLMCGATAPTLADPNATNPWGPRAFCTDGAGRDNSGAPNCVYYTWQQCLASASGTGMHCEANPYYVAPGAAAKSRHRHN